MSVVGNRYLHSHFNVIAARCFTEFLW